MLTEGLGRYKDSNTKPAVPGLAGSDHPDSLIEQTSASLHPWHLYVL